jgi:TonB family protein
MPFGSILMGSLLAASGQSATPTQQSACAHALAAAVTDGAATEICAGDEAARLANAAPKDSMERSRQWQAAASHYQRAAMLASENKRKLLALNQLADCYGAARLSDPKRLETVLREIISLTPNDFTPIFRLARVQEAEGLLDAAEATLLEVHHNQPDAVEPDKMLMHFFARRVSALSSQKTEQEHQPTSNPGEPDANGVYRVGSGIRTPVRDDVPQYPPEALAAGVQGVVITEVVIDPSGNVTDAQVLRSIPLLDDEALRVVRRWHFAPTIVNGQAVPVKVVLTVNFTR